jgi:hypothetical protein
LKRFSLERARGRDHLMHEIAAVNRGEAHKIPSPVAQSARPMGQPGIVTRLHGRLETPT